VYKRIYGFHTDVFYSRERAQKNKSTKNKQTTKKQKNKTKKQKQKNQQTTPPPQTKIVSRLWFYAQVFLYFELIHVVYLC
jgi:hypothetical protein